MWPQSLRLGWPRTDPDVAQAALLEQVARHADEFDIVHCHTDWLHLPVLSRQGVPLVTTVHGRVDLPSLPQRDYVDQYEALLRGHTRPAPVVLAQAAALPAG